MTDVKRSEAEAKQAGRPKIADDSALDQGSDNGVAIGVPHIGNLAAAPIRFPRREQAETMSGRDRVQKIHE
jgi:hypothetical protein